MKFAILGISKHTTQCSDYIHSVVHPLPLSFQNVFTTPSRTSVPNKQSSLIPTPDNQPPTSCLSGFAYFRYFIEVDSHDLWPFVFGSFTEHSVFKVPREPELHSFSRLNDVPSIPLYV